MPQELQVLQCFNCKYFQVQIVKKKPKWACKICKEKQSIKKIFMKSGSGKDCRLLVQELNLHHGDRHDVDSPDASSRESELDCSENNFETECNTNNNNSSSMWDEFLHLKDDMYSQECDQTYSRDVSLSLRDTHQAKNKLPFFESGNNSILDFSDEDQPVPKRLKPSPGLNPDISPIRDKSPKTVPTKGPKTPVISMFEEELCNETDFNL